MVSVESSIVPVTVNPDTNEWTCPLCQEKHIGYHGKKHAYCIRYNTIFQIDWRLV